ncbi:unnamed protein product [Orchesella dallaii]|uniref:Uncharacterized protein n=1 Tax=Orchesella dallaii TaxID=48710 RepID=A0ABP1R556_9HEXA
MVSRKKAKTQLTQSKTIKKAQYLATTKYFHDRKKRKNILNHWEMQKIFAEEREICLLDRCSDELIYMHYKFMEVKYKLGKFSKAAKAAEALRGAGGGAGSGGDSKTAAENMRLGLSVEEGHQILNISPESSVEEVHKQNEHLFEINDKAKGGSSYIQSKVDRAKERLDQDLKSSGTEDPTPKSSEGNKLRAKIFQRIPKAKFQLPRRKTIQKAQYLATAKFFKDKKKRKTILNRGELQKILAEEREIRLLHGCTDELIYIKYKFFELNYKVGKLSKAADAAEALRGGAKTGDDSKTAAENMRFSLSVSDPTPKSPEGDSEQQSK